MQGLGKMVETAFDRAEQRSGQMPAISVRASRPRSTTSARFSARQRSVPIDGRDHAGKRAVVLHRHRSVLSETEKKAQLTAANMRDALLSAEREAQQSIDNTLTEAEKRSGELANRLRVGLAYLWRISIACSRSRPQVGRRRRRSQTGDAGRGRGSRQPLLRRNRRDSAARRPTSARSWTSPATS